MATSMGRRPKLALLRQVRSQGRLLWDPRRRDAAARICLYLARSPVHMATPANGMDLVPRALRRARR